MNEVRIYLPDEYDDIIKKVYEINGQTLLGVTEYLRRVSVMATVDGVLRSQGAGELADAIVQLNMANIITRPM